ncbi:CapA family protein [Rhodohalobacter barkolensis]|uniref:Capsule synthesis protein CapA domain-containing protein n=1 Tax=Rhodohalobacter barkolensis TaxID=2053187 RepID=A0A2N0VGG1_9BACT|nr:CapA family protein [Rhodohalobacter barkolensis]PKD43264.1 hypothetical protein CWD77_11660 [Rhodohalobacter barkolensis]
MGEQKKDVVRIVITGDTHLGGGRVTELARKGNVNSLFGEYADLIKTSDLAISNLESPVINDGTPIPKTGPSLKSPANAMPVLKKAGFDLVTLSNNHIMDYGEEGLYSTIKECKANGLATVGAGGSFEEASKPYFCEISGLKIAILNIAENEFGTTRNDQAGGYGMDPVQNYYSIRECRKDADHVIVIVHGGHEHYELPSPRMKKTYRFFADAGASAVISHHTHCPSGYEEYNGVPICYSLGNFLFDQPERDRSTVSSWHEGLIAELLVSQNKLEVRYHPYIQNYSTPGLRKMNQDEKDAFFNKMERLNNIISDDGRLEAEFKNYCERSYRMYSGFLEPHSNRLLHAMRNRNLAPSMLSDKKKRLLLNLTRCESHRDVLIKTLTP